MTDEQRITKLESEVSHLCDSLDKFVSEVRNDRVERRKWESKLNDTLYGRDNDNPGIIREIDRLKGWKSRVMGHVRFIWGFIISAILAAVGAVITGILQYFGNSK